MRFGLIISILLIPITAIILDMTIWWRFDMTLAICAYRFIDWFPGLGSSVLIFMGDSGSLASLFVFDRQ